LDEATAAAPTCSLAPLFLARNESATLAAACKRAAAAVGRAGACVVVSGPPGAGGCVPAAGLGSRLSPDALNACSVFFLAVLFSVMGNLQEV
jgi:hypothetical protein